MGCECAGRNRACRLATLRHGGICLKQAGELVSNTRSLLSEDGNAYYSGRARLVKCLACGAVQDESILRAIGAWRGAVPFCMLSYPCPGE